MINQNKKIRVAKITESLISKIKWQNNKLQKNYYNKKLL